MKKQLQPNPKQVSESVFALLYSQEILVYTSFVISLYNTLTRGKEHLKHDTDPNGNVSVNMYVCGPTVYDFSHIGHARCYVIYDVLVRHLRASGVNVKYVRNVTDIDDKILQRSKDSGVTPTSLARKFEEAYSEDMLALGNLRPDIEPRVSDHLPEIIGMIQTLIDKGYAYATSGDVYFRVGSFAEYGKLSHRGSDALEEGRSGRVGDEAGKKETAQDFALWKGCDKSEWGFESPFGYGRPGWHIECSAMSSKHLGKTFHLHGGGLDLIFPHHENEIAQSEAANGCTFAHHWMHNGFVEINREKMSKSLGNFFVIRESFNFALPEAVRFGLLTVHYRSPLGFDVSLDDAGNITGFPLFEDAERRLEYFYLTQEKLSKVSKATGPAEHEKTFSSIPLLLSQALDDDLNFPKALAILSDALKSINELLDGLQKKKKSLFESDAVLISNIFSAYKNHMGIGTDDPAAFLMKIRDSRSRRLGIVAADVEALILKRKDARQNKDFALSDQIRKELSHKGVELMDSPEGTSWRIP